MSDAWAAAMTGTPNFLATFLNKGIAPEFPTPFPTKMTGLCVLFKADVISFIVSTVIFD